LELIAVERGVGDHDRADEYDELRLLNGVIAELEGFTDAWDITKSGYLIGVALHVVLHQATENSSLAAHQLQNRFHLADSNLRYLALDRSDDVAGNIGHDQCRVWILDEVLYTGYGGPHVQSYHAVVVDLRRQAEHHAD